MEQRLRPVDVAALNALLDGRDRGEPWGRDSPGRLADRIDFSSQHLISRLQVLEAAGLVKKPDRGIYEITAAGIEAVESESEQ